MDYSFDPYSNLYSCNPRSLYENTIRIVLSEYGIPHRKSGPLNIAKATKGLDESWASQRRPSNAAEAVVRCVKALNNMKENDFVAFSKVLFNRFLDEAGKVKTYDIIYEPSTDSINVHKALVKMMDEATDRGNTPQQIVGILLKCYYSSIGSRIIVTGSEDRASVTNTTSKKPGDIQEEYSPGAVLKVYEVTMKPFDGNRMQDSYEAVIDYSNNNGNPIDEVIVLCRESDCPYEYRLENNTRCIGRCVFHGVKYLYYDIYEWVFNQIMRLNNEGRSCFFKSFGKYVSNPNTSSSVKKKWKNCYELYLDPADSKIHLGDQSVHIIDAKR